MKQPMRSSGANITTKHLEEISLCSLFLMEAAKKADRAFGVHPQSTSHTVRDAKADISKMAKHVVDKKTTDGRTTPEFHDLTDWLEKVELNKLAPGNSVEVVISRSGSGRRG